MNNPHSKLGAVRRHALSLPDVTEQPHFDHSSFRVRGKIFLTVPPDGQHLHVFIDEEQRKQALALHGAFVEKLWWGGKVVGLRINLTEADSAVVDQLVRQAWARRAPKTLQAGASGRRNSR
jgi:hypothetical protein